MDKNCTLNTVKAARGARSSYIYSKDIVIEEFVTQYITHLNEYKKWIYKMKYSNKKRVRKKYKNKLLKTKKRLYNIIIEILNENNNSESE